MKMDSSVQSIELSMIIPPKEKVVIDDNFQKLVESIRMNGILEPLLLRPLGEKYEIVIGNKRYEAARLLGIKTVPVIVKKVDDEVLEQYKVLNNYDKKNHDLNEKKDKFIPSTHQNTKPIKNNTSLSQNSSNKEELQKSSTNNNYFKIQNKRNQYSDIINLSELNKKEYERNDFNMNNNLVNNNVGVTPQTTNLNNQEPTFGGRFFPSLEDEPTNMNMGGMSGQIQQKQEINSNLIDLTDINQESSNPSIMPNANNLNANLSPTPSSGPTLNTNLVNRNIIIGNINYSCNLVEGYHVIRVEANTKKMNLFNDIILDYFKNKKFIFDEEYFNLCKRNYIIDLITRSDDIYRTIDPLIENIVSFKYDGLDTIKDIENILFDTYKDIILNLDFSNYNIAILKKNKKELIFLD